MNLINGVVAWNSCERLKKKESVYSLHKYSIWDSLILATAQSVSCTILLSEDMHNGQQIGSVTTKNPFLKW
ncbi:MAG: hypothetical protein AAF694_05045 [Bacteroidota bacterium]